MHLVGSLSFRALFWSLLLSFTPFRCIDVAAPVVTTDILWCAAGVGTMYDGSRAKLPTSAYAMSTALASRIGFWDAGPEAIGEDLHVSKPTFSLEENQISTRMKG